MGGLSGLSDDDSGLCLALPVADTAAKCLLGMTRWDWLWKPSLDTTIYYDKDKV